MEDPLEVNPVGIFFQPNVSPPKWPKNRANQGLVKHVSIHSYSPRNVTSTQEPYISHMKNKLVMNLAIANSFFLSESSKLVK